jgi:hypothetical protein
LSPTDLRRGRVPVFDEDLGGAEDRSKAADDRAEHVPRDLLDEVRQSGERVIGAAAQRRLARLRDRRGWGFGSDRRKAARAPRTELERHG